MATIDPLVGEVAQLVEHTTENRGVAGSIPALATPRLWRIARLCHRARAMQGTVPGPLPCLAGASPGDGEGVALATPANRRFPHLRTTARCGPQRPRGVHELAAPARSDPPRTRGAPPALQVRLA